MGKPKPKEAFILVDPTTVRAINRLLRSHQLVVRMRGSTAAHGDQRFLRIEELPTPACKDT